MSSFHPKQKILMGDTIRLVPFNESHLTERYISWLNDPEVVRYSDQRFRHHTLESCREYFLGHKDSPNWFWAIETLPEENHIGNINADVNEWHSVADIGILIGEKDYWGKGIATQAYRLAIEFLFHEMQMRKITVGTLSVNQGMLNVMKKLKMLPDGARKRHCLWEGKEVDVVEMALFLKV